MEKQVIIWNEQLYVNGNLVQEKELVSDELIYKLLDAIDYLKKGYGCEVKFIKETDDITDELIMYKLSLTKDGNTIIYKYSRV